MLIFHSYVKLPDGIIFVYWFKSVAIRYIVLALQEFLN